VLNSNRRFRELWNVPEQLDWQTDGAVLMSHMCAQLRHPECGLRLDEPAQLTLPGVQRGAALEEEHEVLHLKDGRVIEKPRAACNWAASRRASGRSAISPSAPDRAARADPPPRAGIAGHRRAAANHPGKRGAGRGGRQ
jgi:hypothetical protein